ncbi:hypothetical protein L2E82_40343 [Cichorium intybus]|uniref:Uncharacterized protein n=1 Tax=Cichorium intybus TaxID=13427 RepID=A0ACB9AQ57_CICIN|nr:hypothetical protein L2E82_40343 [Cichorium intybus]
MGGYSGDGDTNKFHSFKAFTMTMLSRNVIEFVGEFSLVKNGDTSGGSSTPNDHTRVMNIDHPRPVITCSSRYGLVAEIVNALVSVSMFLKDNTVTQRTIWADRRKRGKNAIETTKGKDETEQAKEDLEQFKATTEIKVNFKNLQKKGAEFFLVISKNNEDNTMFYEVFSHNLNLDTHDDSTNETKSVELFTHHSSTSSDEMIRLKDYVTRRKDMFVMYLLCILERPERLTRLPISTLIQGEVHGHHTNWLAATSRKTARRGRK